MKPVYPFNKNQAGKYIIALGLLSFNNPAIALALTGTGSIFLLENKLNLKIPNYSEKKALIILCILSSILLLFTQNQINNSKVDNNHLSEVNIIQDKKEITPQLENTQKKDISDVDIEYVEPKKENLKTTTTDTKTKIETKHLSSNSTKQPHKEEVKAPTVVLPSVITYSNIKNPQLLNYISYLRRQIAKRWDVVSIYGNGYVVLEFSIDKQGNIINPKFIEGSRNQSLDRSVWSAIMSIPNVAQPPEIYNSQKIRLRFDFNNGNYSIY